MKFLKLQPKFKLLIPRLYSGAAIERPETTHLTLPPTPEVVWQQPHETQVTNLHKTLTIETHKNTQMLESKQRSDVESQTSPMRETSSQVSVSSTEPLLGNQTRSPLVQSFNDSKKLKSEIERHEMNKIANHNGANNISPPKITNSQIEEQLVKGDITNELYMPLSSTIVLKQKKEMLYVLLDFENSLTIDALVDSRAYVSAIAQTELHRIKQQPPGKILKIDDPHNFQIQVANGQLEKPISTATFKFDIGDNTFAEHFVLMKNLTGPIVGLHFMRHNSVVIGTTHGLIFFPHLTMQAKKAKIEASAKPQPVLIQGNTTVPPMTAKQLQHLLTTNRNGIQQVL